MSNILDTLNPPTTPKPVEDCVSCRVIGGLTLTALGGYGIGQAITQGKVLSRAAAAGTPPVPGGPTKRGLAIMAFFGVGASSLGLLRWRAHRRTRVLTPRPHDDARRRDYHRHGPLRRNSVQGRRAADHTGGCSKIGGLCSGEVMERTTKGS